MADEVVSIKLKVEAHDRQLTQVIAKLKALEAVEKRLASGSRMQNFAKNQSGALNSMTRGWKRHFDMVDAGIKMMGKGLTGFLKLAIKGVAIEMGLLGATMIAVHATFVAGQLIMKAYKGAMQLVAGAAAGTVVALAAVSAAIREQQAAIYAYRGKGAKEFGSAMSQTRMAMRSLQADADLATLGVEALNQAYGVMSTTMNSRQIAGSRGTLKALMDFGSAGQDPAKGLQAVASVVAALNDPKKGMSAVRAEAKKLGPEMEKALKAANVQTKEQFSQLLYSGELAKLGGVQGQFGAINSTLIAQLKSYMTQVRTIFADYGDQFLEPLKVAFQDIFHILKRDIARIMGAVQLTIGTDGYIDGFVSMIDKVSNWMVKTIREYLPQAVGMFDRIGEWMKNFRQGWNDVLDYLRPLIDGARVLYKMLNPVWEAIKGGVDNLFLMKDLLVDNADTVEEFGERIGGFITALSELMMNMKKIFFDVLPLINDVIAGITQVFKMISGLLTSGAGGGLVKALAPLLAFSVIGRGMQNVKGKLMPGLTPMSPNTMNVQAGVVNIGGPGGAVASTQMSSGRAGAPGAPGALSSGAYGGGVYGPGRSLGQLKTSEGMKLGALMREGANSATRNMNYASIMAGGNAIVAGRPGLFAPNQYRGISYQDALGLTSAQRGGLGAGAFSQANSYGQLARNSLANAGVRGRQGLSAINYRARQAYGGFRGALGFAQQGAYNKDIGGYNNLYAPGGQIDLINKNLKDELTRQTHLGKMGRAGLHLNAMRERNRTIRNNSMFGRGVTRFQGSMGGRMGTSLGLAAASQFAPEEMRGAMALGGMVGQFNPLAGVAVAGLGGAMSARSAGGGALAGAAGGAAAGAMFGPVGALVGAGLGTIFGAWRGAQNKAKFEIEQAKKFAQETIGSLYSGIASAAGRRMAGFEEALARGETIKPGTAGAFENVAGEMVSKGNRLLSQVAAAGPNMARYMSIASELEGADTRYFKQISELEKSGRLTAEEAAQVRRGGNTSMGGRNVLEKMARKDIGGENAENLLRQLYNNQGLFGVEISADQMKGMLKRPEEAIIEMQQELITNSGALTAVQSQTTNRMKMLTAMSGKTAPELEILAKELGFNLYDATLDFSKVVEKLGIATVKSSQQMKFAMQDVFLAGSDVFRKSIEQREGEMAVNQSAAALQATLAGPGSIEEKNAAIEQTMADFFPQMLAASGGDPLAAYMSTQALFGQGRTGGAFAEGGTYAGQGDLFYNNTAFQEMLSQQNRDMPKLAAEQLSALVFSQTGKALDVGSLIPGIAQMSQDQRNKLLTDLTTMDVNTMKGTPLGMMESNMLKTGITAEATESSITTMLTGMGITTAAFAKTEGDVNAVSDAMSGLTDSQTELGIKTETLTGVVETLNSNFDDWFKENGDTSSPRGGRIGDTTTSRLSQTMGRHAMLDSQLTGKRTITSAFRTWGLGSPSSDHVTGRAYDLVGQNLGQYSKLVHANGGFAEFHGAAANRHLHVVPGPGMGDTTTMRATVGAASAGGNTTNYYNFEINGTGMDPEAVAQMVMSKIKETERVNRERS
jgi:hypothetical protein